ncbi:lysozyme [Shumkonia mesophila]|uniref:lysozyme n=1 Tax=Shumkonia mesophila TaxID=2838854 RepID=UPI002934F94F|nr:lysozyme [Shumkonia mesophila]
MSKAVLIRIVGAAAAGILCTIVPAFEGTEYVGYADVGGIPTKCMGDTTDAVIGQRYSEAECIESLETELIAHAGPVLKCVPQLEGHPYQIAASVSLAYNIGTGAFRKSTIAKNFRAGRWAEACRGFPAWNKAGGKVVQGLANRRAAERKLCETELPS